MIPSQFNRSVRAMGEAAFAQLQKTRVILFGTGGVGSWCAEALIRTGIGHITLVDSDVVEPSNINRQIPATPTTIGQSKAQTLSLRLKEIAPAAEVHHRMERYTPDSAPQFPLSDYHYIIDAIDSVPDKIHLIRESLASEATLLSSMGAALKKDPSRIRLSTMKKTHGCPLAKVVRKQLRAQRIPLDFTVVFSDEPGKNMETSLEESGNGSLVHITGIFGFTLAGALITNCVGGSYETDHN
ncbi:tRNA threonylcarbamoyladenosine dehydratase [Chitinivibrio alkaliphilus]|uniref:ThiF family protein n=1 Tax=Chitinivibrio alkaliphilus ACht1 TaxID=1313304 RepID=U7DA75_9BACT|nr:tRNA threonylcarbamoyladenosine dehydratase [Chitinivibrio alkaliphilus]ERP31325.1 ThiF family protein [Chitinivibrio alkaliphilus ACht1]